MWRARYGGKRGERGYVKGVFLFMDNKQGNKEREKMEKIGEERGEQKRGRECKRERSGRGKECVYVCVYV